MDWMSRAACRDRTGVMFPASNAGLPEARSLCARCPVTGHCLGYVLWLEARIGPQDGVWAGLTPSERDDLRSVRIAGHGRRAALSKALRRMGAVA